MTTDVTPNPNKALWEKGDFTRIARPCARAARRLSTGNHRGARGARPRLRRRDDRAAGGAGSGADVLGVDIASNLVEAGNSAREAARASPTAGSRKATRPTCTSSTDDSFDLVVSIFGAMFAPKPFDVAQGDGARDAARRPDRHGQLDPQRPDARRADPEDQRRLLAAAAGGVRQPDDVGRRGRT